MIIAVISAIRQTKPQTIRHKNRNMPLIQATGPLADLTVALFRTGFFLRVAGFAFPVDVRRCATRGRLPDLPVMICP